MSGFYIMYIKIKKKKLFGFICLASGVIFVGISFIYIKPKEPLDVGILPSYTLSSATAQENKIVNTVTSNNIYSLKDKSVSKDLINFSVDGKAIILNFTAGDTLEKAIENAVEEKLIDIKGKNFLGLGFYVNEINGVEERNGYSWIYYINGLKATVGVSTYKLQDGDFIEWKYEKNY